MNSRVKIQEEARCKLLRVLYDNPELTQRELGAPVSISLGAVNYRLRAFMACGLLKVSNFSSNPNKLCYAYVLAPAGIAEKSLLTGRFLKRKIDEFEALRLEIEALSRETAVDKAIANTSGIREMV